VQGADVVDVAAALAVDELHLAEVAFAAVFAADEVQFALVAFAPDAVTAACLHRALAAEADQVQGVAHVDAAFAADYAVTAARLDLA
jgi:hypothetical protein